jgi:hypothetical protein
MKTVDPQSIIIVRQIMTDLRRGLEGFPNGADIIAPVEVAYGAVEREYLHQRLAEASALIEYGLDEGLLRLRDCDGNLLLHLGQWLAAVEVGKWGKNEKL